MTIGKYLPATNTAFKYSVDAEGDNGAMAAILHPFANKYEEIHTYKGIVDNFYGKDRYNNDIVLTGPCKSALFEITRPDLDDVITNYYYAIIDSFLAFYYQSNSKGSRQLFLSPEQMPILPLPLKENYSFESKNWKKFYLSLIETGISLAPKYESSKIDVDECMLKISIHNETSIVIEEKTYRCNLINIELLTKTGSFMTKAKTSISIKRWYAPEIKYYVREEYNVIMDALISSKGSVNKVLKAVTYV